RLIYEEVCLRNEAGIAVNRDELARRFPRWADELALLLDCRRLIDAGPTGVAFPLVGEVLAGFRLLAELGRGAAGRVYLAAQPSLGDRPVALKVLPRGREEHLSLARLQHMNIVPLYSEHLLRDRNLQVLCMPFLGGATLAQVLELLDDQPPAERTGRQIIAAMDRIQEHRPSGLLAGGPYRRFIARASYVEAISSIGASLADGLHYAHERELVHMDIKPSNVLLAGDGQPMLLDFHLARGPIRPDGPRPTWMGGTPEFMSPEQLRALAAVREGRPVADVVDGRADLYSLGMLLYVALGGPVPESWHQPLPTLHRRNARVSIGLSDIIHKCLCHDPSGRYADAAALAADLRRHLADLPLRGVPNRSWAERWGKWRRRRPSALSRRLILLALVASIAAAAAMLGIAYRQRVREIESVLAQGRLHRERHQDAQAEDVLHHGLALAEGLPAVNRQRLALEAELDLVRTQKQTEELHRLAETVRFRYGLAPPPAEEAQSLIRLGRRIWQARDLLLAPTAAGDDPDRDQRVRTDLLDLVILWADLRVRHAAPTLVTEARKEAVRVLSEAKALLGPSSALDRELGTYAQVSGTDQAPAGPAARPTSAWEHYDLGRSYLRSGQLERAAEQFRLGLDLRPQDFWLNFSEGLCHYRLGRFEDAVNAFRVCVALAPETAECYYNRGLAYQALGQLDRALADYNRALARNPKLTDAALNRGILHYRQGRHSEAVASLELALSTTSSPTALGVIHYNLALVHLARGDRAAAASDIRAAIRTGNADARELSRRLDRPAGAGSVPQVRRVE
ncbi:MAG TPA: serine/threonine-protein kinase, partial [Isosphaeraceae bacterium]|nr:serine/threonine-protein kinase [Isosphaeraceae bacterium]